MADEEDTEVTINMSEELEQIRSVMQAQQKALLEAAQTAQATAESTLAEVTRQVEVDKQMRHEAAAKVESVVPEKSRILAQHEAEKQEVVDKVSAEMVRQALANKQRIKGALAAMQQRRKRTATVTAGVSSSEAGEPNEPDLAWERLNNALANFKRRQEEGRRSCRSRSGSSQGRRQGQSRSRSSKRHLLYASSTLHQSLSLGRSRSRSLNHARPRCGSKTVHQSLSRRPTCKQCNFRIEP